MAEQLGEAVLVLRTDDGQYDRGVTAAEGKARVLGAQMDRTSSSSGKLATSLATTGRAAGAAGAQFQQTGQQVVASSGAQRAGMQQLSMQLNDMGTMFALGARPMQIFASQGGQVLQAIQMMSGGAKGFIGFLAGPWGMVITTATIVLTPLVAKMFEAEQAAKLAESGANALATAQTALGDVFDMVSGKLKTQNELLLLNARLTALNLRADAAAKRASSTSALGNFDQGGSGLNIGQKVLGAFGVPVRGAVGRDMAVRGVLRDFQAGKIDRDQALQRSEDLDFSGLAITRQEFQQAFIDQATAQLNDRVADLIDKSLDSGNLASELRQPGRTTNPRKPPKPPKDRTAQIAEQHAAELAQLQQEELRARLDLATDAYERADIQQEMLTLERDERLRRIAADADLSQAQKEAQAAFIKRLYGDPADDPTGDTITVTPNPSPRSAALMRDLTAQEVALANDALARQAATLDAQASITTRLEQRDELESRALELQHEIQRNLLEQDIANGRIADADMARALMAEQQVADRSRLARSQRNPLERYRDEMNETAENMDAAIEEIEVRGMERLNDELTDAIMGAQSLGETFHNVAEQIIADLIRIGLQQMLIKPLATMLFGGGEGGGGGGLLNTVFSSIFGGGRATGGPVSPGKFYAVNEMSTAPGMFIPLGPGRIEPPDYSTPAAAGSGGAAPYFDLRGAVMTEDLLRQMSAISRASSRDAVAGYDKIVGSRVRDNLARRS